MFGPVFVFLDIFAFIVQVLGAAQAAGKDVADDKILRGLHIYMAGVGIQLLFILVFCSFLAKFMSDLHGRSPAEFLKLRWLCYTEACVLLLIVVCVIATSDLANQKRRMHRVHPTNSKNLDPNCLQDRRVLAGVKEHHP